MRCLPFRVQPLPDEPLDSWLEAMAVAYRVPLRDILHAVGLCGELASPAWRGQSTFRRSWLYELADEQVARVSAATGVPAAEVQATTRLHFAACVTRRTPSGRVTALNAAGGQTGRFCPECLAESAGRWKLTWGYIFGFACARHERLLVDECPLCCMQQRLRPRHASRIPTPNLCSNCGADLRQAKRQESVSPGIVAAQRSLLRILATGRATFGIYDGDSFDAREAIDDIRLLQRAAFTHLRRGTLPDSGDVPPTLLQAGRVPDWQAHRAGAARGFSAASSAVGYAIAVHAARSRDTAAELLAGALPDEVSYERYTPVVQDLIADAHGVARRATRKLQLGARVRRSVLKRRRRALPMMLWPTWSDALLRMIDPPYEHRTALSVAVLLVGSRDTHEQALAKLRITPNAARWAVVLDGGKRVTDGIIAAAEALDHADPPIDYARRRATQWGDPLPEKEWAALARSLNINPGGARRHQLARAHVMTLLTGSHPALLPRVARLQSGPMLSQMRAFERCLPKRCELALREIARAQLRIRQIEEPLVWAPPASMIGFEENLPRPPRGNERLATARPMQATLPPVADVVARYREVGSLWATAKEYGVSRSLVGRYLTRAGVQLNRVGSPGGLNIDDAWLKAEYMRGRTTHDLADNLGISESTVRRHLHAAGVERHPRLDPRGLSIDENWVLAQRQRGRSVADLARDLDVGRTTIYRYLRRAESAASRPQPSEIRATP